jgi:hypothetical protein
MPNNFMFTTGNKLRVEIMEVFDLWVKVRFAHYDKVVNNLHLMHTTFVAVLSKGSFSNLAHWDSFYGLR